MVSHYVEVSHNSVVIGVIAHRFKCPCIIFDELNALSCMYVFILNSNVMHLRIVWRNGVVSES